jgi:hypothetical protein
MRAAIIIKKTGNQPLLLARSTQGGCFLREKIIFFYPKDFHDAVV